MYALIIIDAQPFKLTIDETYTDIMYSQFNEFIDEPIESIPKKTQSKIDTEFKKQLFEARSDNQLRGFANYLTTKLLKMSINQSQIRHIRIFGETVELLVEL